MRGSGAFVILLWCVLGAFFLLAGSQVFVSAGEPADSDAMIFGAVCAGAIYLFGSFVIAVIYSATLPRRPSSKPSRDPLGAFGHVAGELDGVGSAAGLRRTATIASRRGYRTLAADPAAAAIDQVLKAPSDA